MECCNGADDNGNGLVDEFGCSCTRAADCTGPDSTVCYTLLGACAPRCQTLGGNSFCSQLGAGVTCRATGECR
jgi:hypothetical protein